MSVSELDSLLAGEIERRLVLLGGTGVDPREARAALHSLRGSSAMAGHTDLSLVLAQLSGRLRGGDARAATDAADLLVLVLARLRAGQKPFDTAWPEPPPTLAPSSVDPAFRAEYLAAVHDRLAELANVVEEAPPPEEALERASRAVHAVKGAAGAVGDDVTAWYCHGLENLFRDAKRDPSQVLALLPRHQSVLALLVEDSAAALATLRGRSSVLPTNPPPSVRRSAPPAEEDTGEHTVRVQGVSLDRVLDRLERLELVHDQLGGLAATSHELANRVRDLRGSLHLALRMLGPPRPWGPPAAALARIEGVARALGSSLEELEHGTTTCKSGADTLRAATQDIRREVSNVRRTTLSSVLARVAQSIERLASREGRSVRVQLSASDVPVDREVAARLVDPLMQLARNALAHGLEPPEERRIRHKNPVGCISLSGERVGDFLRIVCEDDGRGVDVERVRRLAVERGSVSAEAARAAADDELLALLFVPGFTTRAEVDLLAGRGIGLDLSLGMVRRLGGSIRLASRRGSGLKATIELPSERWMAEVLWVRAAEFDLALPVAFTGKIAEVDPARPPVHVALCLGLPAPGTPKLSLELALSGIPTVSVGVDSVGEVEECSIRPLPPLLSALGPVSGAIVRGDGALNLTLDAALLAVRAWALA